MKTDHCILDYTTQPPRLRCKHCLNELPVNLPLPVTEFCDLSRKFTKQHASCPPPSSSTPSAGSSGGH